MFIVSILNVLLNHTMVLEEWVKKRLIVFHSIVYLKVYIKSKFYDTVHLKPVNVI